MKRDLILKGLLEILAYIEKEMRIKISEIYMIEEEEKYIRISIETRVEEYYGMSHMRASDDLCGILEYIENHLSKELREKVDYISGEVGEKGYISISVMKRIGGKSNE